MRDLSEKTVRSIFIICLILLPLQYGVVGVVGLYSSEPWPAFVFPGFKNVYVYGGNYQINEYLLEIEADGAGLENVQELTPQEFFYEIPRSQVSGFLRATLGSEDKIEGLTSESIEWFQRRTTELSGRPESDLTLSYLHRRKYMTRRDDSLRVDSVRVISHFKITEVINREK